VLVFTVGIDEIDFDGAVLPQNREYLVQKGFVIKTHLCSPVSNIFCMTNISL
jgi:hypothetical protein